MADKKPILLLDFDGVIHKYSSGWQGARVISDPPVDGAISFIIRATDYFDVQIYSSRSSQFGGRAAMKTWLMKNLKEYYGAETQEDSELIWENIWAVLKKIKFPKNKPPAFLTIDDRALCFTGEFPEPEELLKFKPWNKKEKTT